MPQPQENPNLQQVISQGAADETCLMGADLSEIWLRFILPSLSSRIITKLALSQQLSRRVEKE